MYYNTILIDLQRIHIPLLTCNLYPTNRKYCKQIMIENNSTTISTPQILEMEPYQISNTTERKVLILWSLTVLLTSLAGDSIILLATVKYNAIKQHKVIVAVMQHMAVSDLLQTIFRVLPTTVAFITDRWAMGDASCHAREYIEYFSTELTMVLTCALTTLKLLLVRYPLKTGPWSTRLGQKICCGMWVLVLCLYLPKLLGFFVHSGDTFRFNYLDYTCNHPQAGYLKSYVLISYFIVLLLSFVVVITTSALLLLSARRSAARQGERVRWEGITTVLLTVGVLLVSHLPWFVVCATDVVLRREHSPTAWRAVLYLQYLNITANFFVYSLSVRSFRHFLRQQAALLISVMRGSAANRQTNRQTPCHRPVHLAVELRENQSLSGQTRLNNNNI